MGRPFYRPLAFGEGSLLAETFIVTRVFEGDAISVHLEVRATANDEMSIVQLFDPEATKPPEQMRPLLDDLSVARNISDPYILEIQEISKTKKDELYLVYRHHELTPLSAEFDELNGLGLSVEECVHFMLGVARALQMAKKSGITHQHLTPSDILFDEQGEVMLRGLGLGALYHGPIGKDTSEYGLSYIAPEQLGGERGTSLSDLYSLGVIGYEMLTGYHPGDCTGAEPKKLTELAGDDPNRWLAALIDRLMERDLSKRKATIDAVVTLLEKHVPVEYAAACALFRRARAERAQPFQAFRGFNPLSLYSHRILLATCLVAILLAVVGALLLQNNAKPGDAASSSSETSYGILSLPGLAKNGMQSAEAIFTGEQVLQANTASNQKTYVNTQIGFSLTAPPDWEINTKPEIEGSLATAYSPENTDTIHSPEISISTDTLKQGETLTDHEEGYLNLLKATFPGNDPKLLPSSGSLEIGGIMARESRFALTKTTASGAQQLLYHSFAFENDRQAIIITFHYPLEQEVAFREFRTQVIQSFHLLSKADVDKLNAANANTVNRTQEQINTIFHK